MVTISNSGSSAEPNTVTIPLKKIGSSCYKAKLGMPMSLIRENSSLLLSALSCSENNLPIIAAMIRIITKAPIRKKTIVSVLCSETD